MQRPVRHNHALIKTQILLENTNERYKEPRIVDEFEIQIHNRPSKINPKLFENDLYGVPDYWNEPQFHQRIVREARHRLPQVFPFNTFDDLKVEVRFTPVATVITTQADTRWAIPYNYTQNTKMSLDHPKHAKGYPMIHEEYGKAYDSIYTVIFECQVDPTASKQILDNYTPDGDSLKLLEHSKAFLKALKANEKLHKFKTEVYLSDSNPNPGVYQRAFMPPAAPTGKKHPKQPVRHPNQQHERNESPRKIPSVQITGSPRRSPHGIVTKRHTHPYLGVDTNRLQNPITNLKTPPTRSLPWPSPCPKHKIHGCRTCPYPNSKPKPINEYQCPNCNVPHNKRGSPCTTTNIINNQDTRAPISSRVGFLYLGKDGNYTRRPYKKKRTKQTGPSSNRPKVTRV